MTPKIEIIVINKIFFFSFILSTLLTPWFSSMGQYNLAPVVSILFMSTLEGDQIFTMRLLRPFLSVFFAIVILSYLSTPNTGGSSITIECITATSAVNVISSNGNKYVLNGASSYSSTIKYGLSTGTYTFTNIPSNHPIAILNDGNSNIIHDKNTNISNHTFIHTYICIDQIL